MELCLQGLLLFSSEKEAGAFWVVGFAVFWARGWWTDSWLELKEPGLYDGNSILFILLIEIRNEKLIAFLFRKLKKGV